MASRSKQTEIHPPTPPPRKLQGSYLGVAVVAEFVHCYKYSVVDLLIIMCIRRHVTLVYPIYSPLFAFQPEHNLEASCLLILLVWGLRWGEHCFVYFAKSIYERACTLIVAMVSIVRLSYFYIFTLVVRGAVHRCGASGSMRACHAAGPGYDPRSEQVSWVRFFRGFSSPVRQMSGNFKPPRSRNIICPSS